jgi:hypothetical protein
MATGLAEQSPIYKHKVLETFCPSGDWRKTDLAVRHRDYLGASEATILSKRGSPRSESQNGSSFNRP